MGVVLTIKLLTAQEHDGLVKTWFIVSAGDEHPQVLWRTDRESQGESLSRVVQVDYESTS